MRAGTLKQRLHFDRPVVTQNDTGEEEITWHHQGTVSGAIEPISANEALRADGWLTEVDTRIVVRNTPSLQQVTTKWRIRGATYGTIYNIRSIRDPGFGGQMLEILATSGMNEG